MNIVDIVLISRDGLRSDVMRVPYSILSSGYVMPIAPKLRTLCEFPENMPLTIERRYYAYEGRRDREKEIFYLEEQP